MKKCPRCLNVLSEQAELCPMCGYSPAENIAATLHELGLDKTQATRIFSDENWMKVTKAQFDADR